MSDNKKLKGVQDDSKVALNEPYEVRYWTKEFSVSEDILREAVAKVGNGVKNIKRFLIDEEWLDECWFNDVEGPTD